MTTSQLWRCITVMCEEITRDRFLNDRIEVLQYRNGFRFSIDAALLAAFAAPNDGSRIVDLGTGCGIIPLILGYRYPGVHIVGVEIQEALAKLATRNADINGFTNRIVIRCANLNSLSIQDVAGPVDLVVSNPPYRRAMSGRINPNRQQAVARHEILTTLSDVVNAACRLLGIGGQFAVIYPAERVTGLLTAMRVAGIEPKQLQTVHSRSHDPARRVLVSGVKGGRPGGAIVRPPLIIYESDGAYTHDVKVMLADG